jgi:DNA gyrase subunit B
LDGGFIYIAQPPLYKIKKGKEIFYAYTDEEKTKVMKKLGFGDMDINEIDSIDNEEALESDEGAEGNEDEASASTAKVSKAKKPSIQRYKGLGEMNPEVRWETTMDPARRIFKQDNIEDAVAADKVFDILMGTDVPARKSFIQSNATSATLDI